MLHLRLVFASFNIRLESNHFTNCWNYYLFSGWIIVSSIFIILVFTALFYVLSLVYPLVFFTSLFPVWYNTFQVIPPSFCLLTLPFIGCYLHLKSFFFNHLPSLNLAICSTYLHFNFLIIYIMSLTLFLGLRLRYSLLQLFILQLLLLNILQCLPFILFCIVLPIHFHTVPCK